VRVLVCGYGNPFRTDDGAGHILAPLIGEFFESRGEDVDVRLEHQPLPEQAVEFDEYDLLVFADARVPGSCSGEGFVIEELSPNPALEGLNIHSAGPGWLMALASNIGVAPSPALLVSVEGESFDFGDNLTAECLSRVEKALHSLEEWFGKNGNNIVLSGDR